MDPDPLDAAMPARRSNWLRLQTQVQIRWIALAGQAAAVLVAQQALGIALPVGPIVMTIGSLTLVNLLLWFLWPATRRLTPREATITLLFDVLQLGALLSLTGGLNNPFALLLLAPVTIAATALPGRRAVIVGALGMAIVLALALVHLPLTTRSGRVLDLPPLFRFGFWVALSCGLVFLSLYARQVTTEANAMREALAATQLALAREQKLTDLGGVVAATAHELGTPLATIKLVSTELQRELAGRPDLAEDAALIAQQCDRCRDILRSMGRAGKEDRHTRRAPLETVVRDAAQPHLDRGRNVDFGHGSTTGDQPEIWRRPEIIHGLRNLVQNAVDFAAASVDVETGWDERTLWVRIEDDGPGFPPSVLARIGDPFVRSRRTPDPREGRDGYEGMGLGLFIAKALLERTGADLSFTNACPEGGAIARVAWRRADIEAGPEARSAALGENARLPG
ncbi:sensor histidine kinase RegB [Wenxinia saemankumensis]|uniref:histidine kinase n=1 Tax=Wenxinia saemankumensis TaxID=1447782 RepID=A0A1M6G3A8_9RHOB|nr:ActS/PrrB/RegB family redox-sensitive histidine kinase [Wenxinia saemankumensis]SHJ04441.1 two-component system, sensor histidine kinase RegB [Wenxinia saemankumensis]